MFIFHCVLCFSFYIFRKCLLQSCVFQRIFSRCNPSLIFHLQNSINSHIDLDFSMELYSVPSFLTKSFSHHNFKIDFFLRKVDSFLLSRLKHFMASPQNSSKVMCSVTVWCTPLILILISKSLDLLPITSC